VKTVIDASVRHCGREPIVTQVGLVIVCLHTLIEVGNYLERKILHSFFGSREHYSI
jgi:hypothetical protein